MANPGRWLALLLDGELQGVPYAEAYGRSLKAIRAFPNFWRLRGYRQACTHETLLGGSASEHTTQHRTTYTYTYTHTHNSVAGTAAELSGSAEIHHTHEMCRTFNLSEELI